MAPKQLTADYLIAGAGAVGMAFADTLLSDSEAKMIIVDRHAKPGGHWNLAYPFVRLHQPSAFYGVSSRELSNGKIDKVGLNKGLGSLASGAEVSAYFDAVMQERFLPSGRVQYFPMCNYLGEGKFNSMLSGECFQLTDGHKTVDATWLKTSVPSVHTPEFKVDDGVTFMPLNDLPKVKQAPDGFVVIGGGKTGIDACLWLLESGVDPDCIEWIMPRDAWLLDRQNTQADITFFNDTIGAQANQFEAIAKAESVNDLFVRLERAGVLVRIDQSVKPKMFHGATISQAELSELRRITNIVRMGRVSHITTDRIILADGELQTNQNKIHVDCSASAISNLESKPVFQGNLITPQTVRSYQPVFSASFIAHIEATREDEKEKNRFCEVVPLPNHDTDWIRMMIPFMTNQYQWSRDSEIRAWLENNRLDGFSGMVRELNPADTPKQVILKKLREYSMPAMAKLQQFKAELDKTA